MSRPPRILVVEDDPGLRVLFTRLLREGGMEAEGAQDGVEMWRRLDAEAFDLILLDLMLPGVGGLDLCRAIRARSSTPIIIVSARGEEIDRVLGLELGADDYVSKPVSHKELLARVRAVLRRPPLTAEAGRPARDVLSFAGWRLDRRARTLHAPTGERVELSGAEHDLLVSFAENPQRVIGRERLLELSRTRVGDSSDRSVDVLVSRLRRKMGDAGPEALIRTVRAVGYVLSVPVQAG